MNGILYIYKEKGMTSFDVVAKLRKILNTKTIGHTGTLDPNAEGLLIVLIGKYTKLLPYCMHDKKGYIASFKLGSLYDTQDIWGNVIDSKEIIQISEEEFKENLKTFVGKQKQLPPMYSAKKVNGKKLYELARKNIEIEREMIDINVFELNLIKYGEEITIDAVVSNGTYIRTLIEDINKKLNNYASMSSLLRYKINNITIDESKKISELSNGVFLIKDPKKILNPSIEIINDDRIFDIKNGKNLTINSNSELILIKNNEELLAIYEKIGNNLYKCKRGLW